MGKIHFGPLNYHNFFICTIKLQKAMFGYLELSLYQRKTTLLARIVKMDGKVFGSFL
jgi:hypothetical protein